MNFLLYLVRHDEWPEDYGHLGGGSVPEWGEDPHSWVSERAGPAVLHQDQWSQHPR